MIFKAYRFLKLVEECFSSVETIIKLEDNNFKIIFSDLTHLVIILIANNYISCYELEC